MLACFQKNDPLTMPKRRVINRSTTRLSGFLSHIDDDDDTMIVQLARSLKLNNKQTTLFEIINLVQPMNGAIINLYYLRRLKPPTTRL